MTGTGAGRILNQRTAACSKAAIKVARFRLGILTAASVALALLAAGCGAQLVDDVARKLGTNADDLGNYVRPMAATAGKSSDEILEGLNSRAQQNTVMVARQSELTPIETVACDTFAAIAFSDDPDAYAMDYALNALREGFQGQNSSLETRAYLVRLDDTYWKFRAGELEFEDLLFLDITFCKGLSRLR